MSEQLEYRAFHSGGDPRPEPADENVRWLTGWLDEPEAMQALSVGRYGRGPYPVELQGQARAARAAVAARPPFEPQPAVLPYVEGDPVLAALSARPDIHATFAGASWQPRYIDLSKVIALQKLIVKSDEATTPAAVKADNAAVSKYLTANAVWLWLFDSYDYAVTASNVHGFSLPPNRQ